MSKVHIHLGVRNLAASTKFYQNLFGETPTVTKPDYVKWQLSDPAMNFAISAREGNFGVRHLGVEVEDAGSLADIRRRWAGADDNAFDEEGASCCYARSNKAWSSDPDGVIWEGFHSFGESTALGAMGENEQKMACC